ncbi:hypothetical protein EG349_15850 [Chryseobacterium shandongense]|uniref:Uncharacterized protein n=1 Tax=Chryseobacterium shandongense TaxID=1493872 RepID=A0AAD0YDQ0_9FLAO|nr:three component ABC system middle component [Chryseobacterium shandongense]AZA88162.1 hypothetical protein EG349_15850 [Chryseobacterium shandongense]AZA96723.1 hypothetical protein EG353_14640 [Chryseobacterium shandongense]
MSEIIEEVRLYNTPAIGAYLLYKFTEGYINSHKSDDAPIALHHFIASAILSSESLKSRISNMRENLQSYIRSFEDSKTSDLLVGIHDRVKEKMSYTWSSIDIAVASGLLYWDTESGKLYYKKLEKSPSYGTLPKPSIKRDGERAEILGRWFSEHELSTITAYLKILL